MSTTRNKDNVLKNLQRLSQHLMKDRPPYMIHRNNAVLLGGKGQYEEAVKEYFKALEEYEKDKLKSLDTPFVGETFNELAVLHANNKQSDKAVECFERAIKEMETLKEASKLSNAQKYILNYKKNLGTHYSGAGQFKKAQTILEEIAPQYKSGEYENAVSYAQVCHELAHVFNEQCKYLSAEPYARESVRVRKVLHGEDKQAPELKSALLLLAAIIGAPSIAKYDEAEEAAQQALDMAKEMKGAGEQNVTAIISAIQQAREKSKTKKTINKVAPTSAKIEEISDEDAQKMCAANGCGSEGVAQCARCKTVRYCSNRRAQTGRQAQRLG